MILLVILVGIIIYFVALYGAPVYEAHQKRKTIAEIRAYIQNDLYDCLAPVSQDFPIKGELEVIGESEWTSSPPGKNSGYTWKDMITAFLHTDASFDALTERERYQHISAFGEGCTDLFQETMQEKFPTYFDYFKLLAGAYEDMVDHGIEYNFYIQTPNTIYKYRGEQDCYGLGISGLKHTLKDPQSIYYKDPNAPTPTPIPTTNPTPRPTRTPSSRPSQGSIREDPHEAHLFDDPDSYADYYAEEFAEEIGESVDEGYQEAYDHWLYWHEGD